MEQACIKGCRVSLLHPQGRGIDDDIRLGDDLACPGIIPEAEGCVLIGLREAQVPLHGRRKGDGRAQQLLILLQVSVHARLGAALVPPQQHDIRSPRLSTGVKDGQRGGSGATDDHLRFREADTAHLQETHAALAVHVIGDERPLFGDEHVRSAR